MSEFYRETNVYERELILESLKDYAERREESMDSGGAGGGLPGM